MTRCFTSQVIVKKMSEHFKNVYFSVIIQVRVTLDARGFLKEEQ